ncbi:MAG: glucose-6-phosphate isomerase [Alphaproteobacteria bacterium]
MTSGYYQTLDKCFYSGSGITSSSYDAALAALNPVFESMRSSECSLTQALLALPFKTYELSTITTLAARIRKDYSHVVVIGSGGSGLSGRMLSYIASPVASSRLHFLENIDPELMDGLLASIDCRKTCFIVISKSGNTVETLSQFYALVHHMKGQVSEQNVGKHFVIITMEGTNLLREAAESHNMAVLAHPADIGGRFSALTAVGLLPAALCGLDISRFRAGAAAVVTEAKKSAQCVDMPSAQGAALQYAAMQAGKSISVMLPYSERLCGFSAWYRQSWAESLGKDGKGTTPIRAVGSTDQHSQLQLYLSGPKDKLFTFITCKRASTGLAIHAPAHIDYLAGKTLGDVMEAQQRATITTLARNNCPVRSIALDILSEYELGMLIMHFTLEILFMAKLLNVNPFDQPVVEEGKHLARDYLLGKNV